MLQSARKIAVVLFLTILIWVWAYMALEDEFVEYGTFDISPSTNPGLLVTFDKDTPVRVKITLKGPAAKILELRKLLSAEKESLEFFYNAEQMGQAGDGTYLLDVLQFLKASDKLKKLGLTAQDCEIKSSDTKTIEVTVKELLEKPLIVQCRDENGSTLEYETIEPSRVKMYVLPDWTNELLKAWVTLTTQQIEHARKERIIETPIVELIPGTERRSKVAVAIKLRPAEESLLDKPLQTTIGYIYSQKLKGKYDVVLSNEDYLRSTTRFKATEEAFEVYYKKTIYQILIEIKDGDETLDEVTRKVIYNFPPEYFRKNDIRLDEPVREAKFKLVPPSSQPPQS